MNIQDFSLLELGVLSRKLAKTVSDNPQLENIALFHKEVKAAVEADPRFQKGLGLEKIAEEHGLDDGYADASDYFFAIYNSNRLEKPYAKLLLCFKCQWWMNGETFSPERDGYRCRNFYEFVPKKVDIEFDFDYMQNGDEVKVRKWLLKAGMEEKPELVTLYQEYLDATDRYYDRKRK